MAKIFVQNFASYNAGVLDGSWYDLDDYADVDELVEAVKIKNQGAEEFGIFDSEGFPSGLLSESESIENAFAWYLFFEKHGNKAIALIDAMGAHYFSNAEDAEFFIGNNFYGVYNSIEEFAKEFAINCGYIDEDSLIYNYIDWLKFWDCDLCFSFESSEINGKVYFFNI